MNNKERESLILKNKKLVSLIIRKHYYSYLDNFDDLFQEGLIALMDTIDKYGECNNFVGLAYVVIKNRIYKYVTKLNKFPKPIDIYDEQSTETNYAKYLAYDVDFNKVAVLTSIKNKLTTEEYNFILQVLRGNTFRTASELVGFKKSHSPILVREIKRKLNLK